ncbi:ribbon-helix-helix protein, CopG family [Paramicrobacterium chengjingii]|nr:ribbon-helix-helix protein, CopG family [Microbacterium chengjingii]
MKTTMNLPDALMAELKKRAADENRTVTSIVEESLRRHLETERLPQHRCALPTWRSGGYHIDVDDKNAVWDVLDDAR